MRPARLAVMLSAVLLATALGTASGARAHDSHAPAGAAHNWLPAEGWVFQHWLPFDERALSRGLGASATTIRLWLRDDHHTLSMLARRRGIGEPALLDTLTARWRGRVPTARYRALRIRTSAMLSQGHLAQHVLFHVFHGPGIPTAAPAIFGVSREAFLAARQGASHRCRSRRRRTGPRRSCARASCDCCARRPPAACGRARRRARRPAGSSGASASSCTAG